MYEARGYDPIMMGQRMEMFRQFGMPFTQGPRARLTGTGRACRALHAVRHLSPADELTALRLRGIRVVGAEAEAAQKAAQP